MSSVSVIIVNWNSGALLRECLRHLRAQTLPPNRVYVVDNASSDGSAEDLGHWDRLVLIRNDCNLGFAAGNNLALSRCDTEFVALLNPDAFPEPEWLERLLAAAQAHPEAAAFGCRQVSMEDPGILDGIGDSYHLSGLVWRHRHGSRLENSDLVPREIFSPCAAAALYRRQAVRAVGGFDRDFFCYVEDVDLGFRLRLAGYCALYVPDAVVCHYGSATTGGQHSDFSLYHGHRNLVWTFCANMPAPLFLVLLPAHIVLNLISIVWFASQGRGRVIIRAKLDALKGLPRTWVKRQRVQSRRSVGSAAIWRVLDKRWAPTRRRSPPWQAP